MNISRMLKNLIAALAVLNIIAMMVFQYGLPSLYWSATNDVEETNQWNLGTIEAVEKEEAIKEEEVAESFLARDERWSEEESEEDDAERDPDAPILELTDDHIYLKVGERFNYMSYIETMVDVDGSDLSHYIYLNRDVDTSEPGDIELIYRITSTITGKSTSQVLLVTIQE
ncbi:MAG: hypothetical protein K6G34_09840 [Lachnospiraceae bacterium]|nr:hypothetical protein [Lachnospiraceae bacterium]